MPYFAHGTLIRELRKFISKFGEPYNQDHLLSDAERLDYDLSINTLSRAEQASERRDGHSVESIQAMAAALSHKLKSLRERFPDHELFQPLNHPKLGYTLDRAIHEADPIIALEHLIMNHESKYMIDKYHIHLVVWPEPGNVKGIEHAGKAEAERFEYGDVATIDYRLRFSKNNQRLEPGFRLAYNSHYGRVELIHPTADKLSDSRNYLIHRTGVNLLPHPSEKSKPKEAIDQNSSPENATHRLAFKVLGGFGLDNEGAHFSFAQPAHYRNIKFTLDLNGYPDASIIKLPELMMVPVLKDRPFDCCGIARDGKGLPIKPDERRGHYFEWRFRDLADVMIGIHWRIDHDQIPPDFKVRSE